MKNTQSCTSAKRKDKRTRLLAMPVVLLMMLSLLLPATALAAPRRATVTPPLTKPQQIVDLAGVSVVRLSLEYLLAQRTSIFCTTLGTIIASWPAQSATDNNNWVLTDGSLLNQSTKNTCAPDGTLYSIKILASNEFTNNQTDSAQLGLLYCNNGVCSDTLNGIETILMTVGGAVLFSFHTSNPLPYVDVEKAATIRNPAPTAIELANSNNTIPSSAKNIDPTTLGKFLTPIANIATPGSAQATEPGMPFIDGNGKITGAQLFNTTSPLTTADIENLEQQLVLPPGQTLSQLLKKNTLSQQWNTGIIQFEQGKNTQAIQTLRSIQDAPLAFQAPATFIRKAQANLPTSSGTPVPTSAPAHGQSNQGAFLDIPLLVIVIIAAMLVLVSLLLLVSNTHGIRRLERNSEKKPKGSFSVFMQTQSGRLLNVFNKLKQAPQTRALGPKPLDQHMQRSQFIPANPDILCPNCGQKVPDGAAFCPNCRYLLVPNIQGSRPNVNTSPASVQPIIVAPLPQNRVQPQQPAQVPKMQDDPAIQAALERLWDKAGR